MSLIGKNIKFIRRNKQLSQEALAREVGLNRGNIASYEGGKVLPSAKNLLKIAAFLEVDMADMVQEDLAEAAELVVQEKSSKKAVDRFHEFAQRLPGIIEGQRAYHQMQKERKGEIPDEYQYLIHEYDRVLNVLEVAGEHIEKIGGQLTS